MDESWPTDGIPSSFYARHKAACERTLDDLELRHRDLRVVRLRPGLIFQREAAQEIRRLFAGPLLPSPLVRPELIPVVPDVDRLVFQAVHADDVGEAYRLAATDDRASGAYNIAAEPVLDVTALALLLGARPVRIRARVLRAAAALELARAAAADAARVAGHGARRTAHGHAAGTRGAGMDAPPRRRGDAARAAGRHARPRRRGRRRRWTPPRAARCGSASC